MTRKARTRVSAQSRSATLRIKGPLARTDLPGLLERAGALLAAGGIAAGGIEVLWCEVAGVAPDAVAVDALARLALVARRNGCQLRMCGASEELRALIGFVGLREVLS